MILEFKLNDKRYDVDRYNYNDVSIPQTFKQDQPSLFGAPPATKKTFKAGDFVADTTQGGSCNAQEITFIPHCNGTHTECISHIIDKSTPLALTLKDVLIPSVLITIEPKSPSEIDDVYRPDFKPSDKVIDKASLKEKLDQYTQAECNGVLIRTTPNEENKLTQIYDEDNIPPFLSIDAIEYLNEKGVVHLLVDVPSIDRIHDEGKLTAHHIFWGVPENSSQAQSQSKWNKTITEMIYVNNDVKDGFYLLDLQIAPFYSDAAPSRPILLELNLIEG